MFRLNRLISLFLTFIFLLIIEIPGKSQFLGYKLLSDKNKASIPFEVYNNLVVISVKLNGIIPLKLVVDSGVRSSILTDKVITDVLQLPYSRKITVSGPGDFLILEAYVVNNVDIVMEGVVGADQSILVLEEDYLQLRNYLGTDVHGLIGYDLFNRFVVDLNYKRKVMTLHEPQEYKPKRRYSEIPLTIEDTKPYIRANVKIRDTARLNGKFMMDTGASHAIMLNEQSSDEIFIPEPNLNSDIGRGLGGTITGKLALIDQIQLNEFEFEEVIASFPDPESYPDSIGIVYRNGTIGGEILSRFRVVFDYFNQKMYFKKNSKYREEFGYNMSGITVVAEGDDLEQFKIAEVREGSPADEVDIRVNDYIVFVDGVEYQKLDLTDIYKLFNYKEGKKVLLHIRRDNDILKKKFKLEDILDPDN